MSCHSLNACRSASSPDSSLPLAIIDVEKAIGKTTCLASQALSSEAHSHSPTTPGCYLQFHQSLAALAYWCR